MNIKNINIQTAIIGFLAAIVGGFVSSWAVSSFSKNNELETRMFDIKKTVYSDFLDEYYKSFNNSIVKEKYEKLYENVVTLNLYGGCGLPGRSDFIWQNIDEVKKDLEDNIKTCYYEYPNRCNTSTCFGIKTENVMVSGFTNNTLASIIGESQKIAMKMTLDELISNFIDKTYKFQLILPENIYSGVIARIESKLYMCENCFRDCNGENLSECGFDFDIFHINDNKNQVFISSLAIEELRKDLQKHYK